MSGSMAMRQKEDSQRQPKEKTHHQPRERSRQQLQQQQPKEQPKPQHPAIAVQCKKPIVEIKSKRENKAGNTGDDKMKENRERGKNTAADNKQKGEKATEKGKGENVMNNASVEEGKRKEAKGNKNDSHFAAERQKDVKNVGKSRPPNNGSDTMRYSERDETDTAITSQRLEQSDGKNNVVAERKRDAQPVTVYAISWSNVDREKKSGMEDERGTNTLDAGEGSSAEEQAVHRDVHASMRNGTGSEQDCSFGDRSEIDRTCFPNSQPRSSVVGADRQIMSLPTMKMLPSPPATPSVIPPTPNSSLHSSPVSPTEFFIG